MKEHDYIKELTLKFFNSQFNRQLRPVDFSITCIAKKQDYFLAFEVFTLRTDDFLRMRVYLQMGSSDNLQPFKLEVSSPYYNNSAEDEVWITLGSLDVYHLESGFLKENNLLKCPGIIDNILLLEDGTGILTEDGGFILME